MSIWFAKISTVFLVCLATHGSLSAFVAPTPSKEGTRQRGAESAGTLSVDTVVEREMSGGEVLSFSIELVASQYVRILAETGEIPIQMNVVEPDGQVIGNVEHSWGSIPTPVSAIARSSGVHHLQVEALGEEHQHGKVRLRIDDLRKATPQDQHRVRAESLFSEAELLRGKYMEESFREAIEKYELAVQDWIQVSDHRQAAEAKCRIGLVSTQLGALEDALTAYVEGLELVREAANRPLESEILSDIGFANALVGDNGQAMGRCQDAMSLAKTIGHLRGEAKASNCLGEAFYHSGKLNQAVEFYNQAQSMWRSLSDRQGQAQTLLFLGYSFSDLSELDRAQNSYQEALSFYDNLGDKSGLALTQVALGRLYFRKGENQRALNSFNDAMKLVAPMGDKVWQASIFAGISSVYYQMAEYQKALVYKAQALELFRAAHLRMAELEVLLSLGEIVFASGDHPNALDYFKQALELSRELENRRCESQSLGLIGMVFKSQGEPREALEYFERALSTMSAGEDRRTEAHTLRDIGEVYEQLGKPRSAVDYYARAVELSRSAKDYFGEVNGLYQLAGAERSRANLAVARRSIEESLNIIESLRSGVHSRDLRSSYLASVYPHYELYIDVLMQLHAQNPSNGLVADAFHASERARARSLLESLTEAGVDIRQGIDPDLLRQERTLQRSLNAKAGQQMRLLSSEAEEEERAAIAKEIQELTTQYEQLQSLIRSKSPRYAALTQPQPLSLPEIQGQVLDDETLLLEYSLGEQRSFLWAVTNKTHTSHEIPPRAEIEQAARAMYGLLTARQPLPEETMRGYRARVKEADSQYWEEAARLSEMVLGPVASELGRKRLLVVSDGALQYLPFGALPVPAAKRTGETPVPLVVEHEIVSLPSASTLAVLRIESEGREPAEKSVAVLADPVFEVDDPRLASTSGRRKKEAKKSTDVTLSEAQAASALHRALRDISLVEGVGLQIPRLPATRQEAEAIIAATSSESSFKAVGFQANRTTATNPDLGQYRIVHFATHGLLNSEHPELSGIILSMVDDNGQPQDGFLRLHDIYNLKLPVDLVVLSACNSGLGKQVRGEGLVGVVRGFMYAGAERVVASLWKVDDEATGELMKRFYHEMLQEDLPPAAALRQAQLEMWESKSWNSPFYWAAFVMQGDWQ